MMLFVNDFLVVIGNWKGDLFVFLSQVIVSSNMNTNQRLTLQSEKRTTAICWGRNLWFHGHSQRVIEQRERRGESRSVNQQVEAIQLCLEKLVVGRAGDQIGENRDIGSSKFICCLFGGFLLF